MESVLLLVGPHHFSALWEFYLPHSQPLSTSQLCSSWLSTWDEARKKQAFLAMSHTAQAAKHSLITSYFSLQEKLQARKTPLLALSQRRGDMDAKSYCSFYLLQCIQTPIYLFIYLIFLLWCPRPSKLENCTSTKAVLFMNDCLRHCFPGALGLWLKGSGACLWPTAVVTAGTKVCMPVIQCITGQDFSWVPWCMVPTAPTKALLTMNGCHIIIVE